jgi:hypothetical protein
MYYRCGGMTIPSEFLTDHERMTMHELKIKRLSFASVALKQGNTAMVNALVENDHKWTIEKTDFANYFARLNYWTALKTLYASKITIDGRNTMRALAWVYYCVSGAICDRAPECVSFINTVAERCAKSEFDHDGVYLYLLKLGILFEQMEWIQTAFDWMSHSDRPNYWVNVSRELLSYYQQERGSKFAGDVLGTFIRVQ